MYHIVGRTILILFLGKRTGSKRGTGSGTWTRINWINSGYWEWKCWEFCCLEFLTLLGLCLGLLWNFLKFFLKISKKFSQKSFPKTAFISSPVLFIEPAYKCHYHKVTWYKKSWDLILRSRDRYHVMYGDGIYQLLLLLTVNRYRFKIYSVQLLSITTLWLTWSLLMALESNAFLASSISDQWEAGFLEHFFWICPPVIFEDNRISKAV